MLRGDEGLREGDTQDWLYWEGGTNDLVPQGRIEAERGQGKTEGPRAVD